MSTITIFDGLKNKHKINKRHVKNRKAVYGIYCKGEKVLMVKDSVSNKWEFPGGGVEKDEDNLKSLKREFLEETGLRILEKKRRPGKQKESFI